MCMLFRFFTPVYSTQPCLLTNRSTAIGSVIRSEEQHGQRITWPSQTPLGARPNIYVTSRKEQ
jgi:hypothetical protein